jgi:hypothetical protein
VGKGGHPRNILSGIQVKCHPQLDWGSSMQTVILECLYRGSIFLIFLHFGVTELSFLPHLYIWRVLYREIQKKETLRRWERAPPRVTGVDDTHRSRKEHLLRMAEDSVRSTFSKYFCLTS